MNVGERIDAIRQARGMSVLALSKEIGVCLSAAQRQLKTGGMRLETLFAYARVLGFSVGELLDPELDVSEFTVTERLGDRYPWNLVADVAGIDPDDTEALYEFYIPDVMRSIECLSERTRMVLDLRYRKRLTLREIGRQVELTPERIRQIIAKAVRILRGRHMKRWRIDWIKTKCADAESRVTELEEENGELRKALQKYRVDIEKEKAQDQEFALLMEHDINVLDLDLSVRSVNSLKRARIDTIGDLSRLTYNELLSVRNLGRKSVNEIITKMHELGVYLKDEQEDAAS